ncbi:MAG: GDP-mannose 4,6-dehydratase, partial [Candidatus Omnitrophica bacterium]|nr:GDP-mannose 4,6-dehydratase [Candidatus Omnitrophota bacterium]
MKIKKKILILGGAGFIGSEFVRKTVKKNYKLFVIDKLSYAGDLERLKEVMRKITFYKTDICNRKNMEAILKRHTPQIVINFAASTHVDRSIMNSGPFIKTNIYGVRVI